VSPSKKANKKAPSNGRRPAQEPTLTSPARSSRAAANNGRTRTQGTQTGNAPAKAQSKPKVVSLQTKILRIVAILAVIGVTLYTYTIRERVEEFQAFGYPGIFVIALIANATILLPAPGAAIIYAMGAVFNPWLVGLAAGSGGAIGELSGYLAGFSGQGMIERTDIYDRIKPWIDKYGGWAILVLSAIPNPLFDVAGVAAGIAKMPIQTFLFFVWIGQLIKMTLFALAGKYSIEWFANFIN
jgi:membrane protein DedA with SNARE-associated domain